MADAIKEQLADQKGLKKRLIEKAMKTKMKNALEKGVYKHCLWDKLVFKKIQKKFGGRVRLLISGSAPLSKDTISFLKMCFSCPFSEGYGLTETLFTSQTWPEDKKAGIVGGTTYCVNLMLQDVPDMKYFVNPQSHKEKVDYTRPRGEICYKGPSIFNGYFREPEKTQECFDGNGWFHTGDVGELQENNALKIIDRKKNIFKLSQGEYIAPDKLENAYVLIELIMQIFVYGDSLHPHLVAIVVPDKPFALKWAEANGQPTDDYEALIKSKEFED